jgi:hypothetical protein
MLLNFRRCGPKGDASASKAMEEREMDAERSAREREFETLLLEILRQDYDLPVRHGADRLERRRRGLASLGFEYHYSSPTQAKVVVSVEGLPSFSNLLPLDLASTESITRCAEDCEALALFLMEHLEHARDALLDQYAAGELCYGRREDDCS